MTETHGGERVGRLSSLDLQLCVPVGPAGSPPATGWRAGRNHKASRRRNGLVIPACPPSLPRAARPTGTRIRASQVPPREQPIAPRCDQSCGLRPAQHGATGCSSWRFLRCGSPELIAKRTRLSCHPGNLAAFSECPGTCSTLGHGTHRRTRHQSDYGQDVEGPVANSD